MKKMKNVLAAFLAVCLLVCMVPAAISAEGTEDENIGVYFSGEYRQSESKKAFDLINDARGEEGLPALKWDSRLEHAAMRRAVECIVRFDINRPDNRDDYSVLDDYSISYDLAMEHIAYGYSDASSFVNNFLEDEAFRADILDEEYTHIGIGCVAHDGELYWVELFISDPASEVNDPCGMEDDEFTELIEIYGPYADVSLYTIPETLTGLAVGDRILATLQITCNFPEKQTQIVLDPKGFKWEFSNEDVAKLENEFIVIIGTGTCQITIRDIDTDEIYETFLVSTESYVVVPTSPTTNVIIEPTDPSGEQPTEPTTQPEDPTKVKPSSEATTAETTDDAGSGSTKNPQTGTGSLLPLMGALAACAGMVLAVSRKKK